ncbi:fibronectin type III domain-containing protein [Sphaerisporangium album]|uniref:Fibronectin type III domain-containing protein n=2 Tax=Sphaerisporangium album TaxID=509200 RepID=A0A367F8A3_9ACTN|nr:fibronectin type III domain-containing protein [Sphaerisporangium album]
MAALLACGLTACSTAPPPAAATPQPALGVSATPDPEARLSATPEPEIRLSATLVSPTDITLEWTEGAPGAAGRIVEFATAPRGQYTILEFVPPGRTTFTHPDLIPQTPFYYRVRPYYGPASQPVEVRLPKGEFDEKTQHEKHAWLNPRTIPGGPVDTHPIRDARTAASAAPSGLRATVMHANGVRFTWTDHANDEEGYLLEVRPTDATQFHVAAVMPPDVNSTGLITLPSEKHSFYRVRAFYYGQPSNLAHQTTGPSQE